MNDLLLIQLLRAKGSVTPEMCRAAADAITRLGAELTEARTLMQYMDNGCNCVTCKQWRKDRNGWLERTRHAVTVSEVPK